jgi:hypothetical protein
VLRAEGPRNLVSVPTNDKRFIQWRIDGMAGRARAMGATGRGAIWLGARMPMPNQVNKKFINLLKLIIF